MNNQPYIDFIHELAEKSGEVIRPWFLNPDLDIEAKQDETPVTIADRRAEEVMRELIRQRFPGHGIIGEEYGRENEDAEFVWVLDPIDGTISFTHGSPHFATLICLLREGQPFLGAFHQPILKQLCLGDNTRTTLNGRVVRVREQYDLARATLLTTDIKYISRYQDQAGFDRLLARTGLFRTWGDCYGYFMVATGRADIVLDPIMNPWDLLPLIPIIRGAGGVISDWQGKDAVSGTSSVAANPQLHPQVIEILN